MRCVYFKSSLLAQLCSLFDRVYRQHGLKPSWTFSAYASTVSVDVLPKWRYSLTTLLCSKNSRECYLAVYRTAGTGEFALGKVLNSLVRPDLGIEISIRTISQFKAIISHNGAVVGVHAALPELHPCIITQPLTGKYFQSSIFIKLA